MPKSTVRRVSLGTLLAHLFVGGTFLTAEVAGPGA
jgi:hypothetical protein